MSIGSLFSIQWCVLLAIGAIARYDPRHMVLKLHGGHRQEELEMVYHTYPNKQFALRIAGNDSGHSKLGRHCLCITPLDLL